MEGYRGRVNATAMIQCKVCKREMHESSRATSKRAIAVLESREGTRESVVARVWHEGPLCDRCLAAWSAEIAKTGR